MITPKILPAICLLLFSQINGQPKILNESFNNFNGAFRTQPKIPHSIQKQHNLITENQLTGKSSSIFGWNLKYGKIIAQLRFQQMKE
jgi:hypothetical protein